MLDEILGAVGLRPSAKGGEFPPLGGHTSRLGDEAAGGGRFGWRAPGSQLSESEREFLARLAGDAPDHDSMRLLRSAIVCHLQHMQATKKALLLTSHQQALSVELDKLTAELEGILAGIEHRLADYSQFPRAPAA